MKDKEPNWNISHVCLHHAEAVLQYYQKDTDNVYFKGDFVKTAFKMDDDTTEHMWVKATAIDKKNNLVIGNLWNIPLGPSKEFFLKASVVVEFSKISCLIRPNRSNIN